MKFFFYRQFVLFFIVFFSIFAVALSDDNDHSWKENYDSKRDQLEFFIKPVRDNYKLRKIRYLLRSMKLQLFQRLLKDKRRLKEARRQAECAEKQKIEAAKKFEEEQKELFKAKGVLDHTKWQFLKTKRKVENEDGLISILDKILKKDTFRDRYFFRDRRDDRYQE